MAIYLGMDDYVTVQVVVVVVADAVSARGSKAYEATRDIAPTTVASSRNAFVEPSTMI